jgi:protein translocase SecG subunit
MTLFLTVLHVLVCVVLLITVLLQRGKGAEIGAVFGSGSSTTMFGARGAGTFLTKLTTGAAGAHWEWGWKNFFDEDEPGPPSPESTMSKDPTPVYVSYQ